MAPDERCWATSQQQQRRLLLKQVCLDMTLERAQSRIWCSKIGWQTVPCPWSIDGEAALTNSSPGMDQQRSHCKVCNYQIGPNRRYPVPNLGHIVKYVLWTKSYTFALDQSNRTKSRHPVPNRNHFLTYVSKTSHPARLGSNLSWHCQFVYEKLISDAKKNNLC